MRISVDEVNLLKKSLRKISETAELYLFGSRTDDTKKGGDIDLLIVADDVSKKDLRDIRLDFFKNFGEQKIDILLDNGELQNSFIKMILDKAIML